MKVFSELGQLIEEDQKNQLKITSLNSDIMQKIGSYLLEDKNKLIVNEHFADDIFFHGWVTVSGWYPF